MKKALLIGFVLVFGLYLAPAVLAADEAAIQSNVDQVVEGINGGKSATDYKAGDCDPYVFIMEKEGKMVVHPKLEGQDFNTEEYKPVYDALTKATPEGTWVEYEWQGTDKKSYVRTTDGGLIVGSGYTKE